MFFLEKVFRARHHKVPKSTGRGVDLLVADAKTLRAKLQRGELSSVDLVDACLDMIQKHDGYLHAMLSLAPRQKLREIARDLDQERRKGNVRGPLHGIPIVLKDNIATHPGLGMNTTCGSYALQDMRPSANAKLVEQLIEAGLIIIGKANLSEWSCLRSHTMPSAWSALGGQCQSAYVRGGLDPSDSRDGHSNPSGSSSGSAVSVSAGYAPFSIGTEPDGSLVAPASRAALYAIKPTVGLVSQEGIVPVSHTMDSAGPMAKTPYDLAALLDVIREPVLTGYVGPEDSLVYAMDGCWDELSIATLDYNTWWTPKEDLKPVESATRQMHKEIQAAYNKMRPLVKTFVENVPLVNPSKYMINGRNSQWTVMVADFKSEIDEFLESIEYSQVRNLKEIIDFNIENSDVEFPPGYDDQQIFLDAQKLEVSPEDYHSHLSHLRKVSRSEGADLIFDRYNVDLIVGPADSLLPSIASGSGYPIGSVPLGYLDYNGRPFGLAVMAAPNQEAMIFRFMSAWESTFSPRKPPAMLRR